MLEQRLAFVPLAGDTKIRNLKMVFHSKTKRDGSGFLPFVALFGLTAEKNTAILLNVRTISDTVVTWK